MQTAKTPKKYNQALETSQETALETSNKKIVKFKSISISKPTPN